MVFAELKYDGEYAEQHTPLHNHLAKHFTRVESGLQGDSYVWVFRDSEKVAVDTFTSVRHQVKSAYRGSLVREVMSVLQYAYEVSELS